MMGYIITFKGGRWDGEAINLPKSVIEKGTILMPGKTSGIGCGCEIEPNHRYTIKGDTATFAGKA